MPYVVIAVIVIILIYLKYLNSPKTKGIRGEKQVNRVLKRLALEHGGIELTDFMLEDQKSSSQIDNILLTQKALYVIEVKNYRGMIFGSKDQINWTVTIKTVYTNRSRSGRRYKKAHISKNAFYNPIKQNQTHIRKIQNLIPETRDIPVINLVVFGNHAILSNLKQIPEVVSIHDLRRAIKNHEASFDDTIDVENQIEIVDALHYHNVVDKRARRDHVLRIKEKHGK